MYELHDQYNRKVEMTKTNSMQSVYATLCNSFQELARGHQENTKALDQTMIKHIQYTAMEHQSLGEVNFLSKIETN